MSESVRLVRRSPDKLGVRFTRSAGLIALAVALVATPVASMAFGAAAVPPGDVFAVMFSHLPGVQLAPWWDRATDAIVWQNRLPRVLTGIGVGAILGVSGVALQAMVRNPLAEPYVLGVSAGASTGAAAAMVLVGITSGLGVAGFAFAGAAIATVVVLGIGGRSGQSALQLVLAGVAVGFIFQALTNLIIFASDSPETSRSVMFWTLGSLARATWVEVGGLLLVAGALSVGLWLAGPLLDALTSGDATATAVGVSPAHLRLILVFPVSAGVAFAVATAGGIGFVGLVVPHLLRSWIGHDNRTLVLGSAMAGAIFLVWADTLSRTFFSPAEVPIGVVTGLLGAPFLLLMVRRQGMLR